MKKLSAFLGLMKKSKLLTFLVCNLGLLIPAITLSTVAWFSNQSQITPNIESSVVTSYFEGGDGTENNPYIIYRPVQYYNLVRLYANSANTWLDRSSYFAFGDDKDEDGVYKFASYNNDGVAIGNEESTSLNMGYYNGTNDRLTIIPLGDQNNPFEGHIIGRGLTVANLIVEGKGMPDVGIFGYVTEYARIENAYFKNVRININNPSLTNSHGHDDDVRVGHIAGHAVDAKSSFNNVYTSNNKIYNSRTSSLIKSNFGDYGKNDAISSIKAGANENYSFKASDAYNAIDSVYDGSSAKKAISRDTEYSNEVLSETLGDVVSKNTNSYSINSSTNRKYSLSSIGYQDSEIIKNYTYLNATNDQVKLPKGFKKTNVSPNTQTKTGDYTYYDSTKGNWIYYRAWSNSSTVVTSQYNVFTASYQFKATTTSNAITYYLICENDEITKTSVAPATPLFSTSNLENNKKYFWSFLTSPSSLGLDVIETSSEIPLVKLFSPASGVFLTTQYKTGSTRYQDLITTTSYSNGTSFKIVGPNTSFKYTVDGSSESYAITPTMENNTLTDGIMGSPANNSRPAFQFKLSAGHFEEIQGEGSTYYRVDNINNLASDSTVAIASDYSTNNGPKAMGEQNSNNRKYTNVTMTTVSKDNPTTSAIETSCVKMELNAAIDTSSDTRASNYIAPFKVEKTVSGSTTTLTFKEAGVGYLYASSSSKNYLVSKSSVDDNAKWTATFDSSTKYFTLIAQGENTRNRIYYNATNMLFSAYTSTNAYSGMYKGVQLFVRDDSEAGIAYKSTAETFTAEAPNDNNMEYESYDCYISDLNASNYDLFQLAESSESSIVFDTENSRVTYYHNNPDSWKLVKNLSTLKTGDTVALASYANNYAMSSSNNDTNTGRKGISITKNADETISGANINSICELIIGTGTTSNTYSFLDNDNGGYLASLGNTYLETESTLSANSSWTISASNSNGAFTFSSKTSSANKGLHFDTTNNIFNLSSGGSSISIYLKIKGTPKEYGVSYIADNITDENYKYQMSDVVGNATINENSIILSGNKSNLLSMDYFFAAGEAIVGQKFYNTQFCDSSIVLRIPNTGSLDLGTLTITYTSSSSELQFIKGTMTDDSFYSKTLTQLGCTSSTSTYELSINMYNIFEMCFCGLDSSGNIAAVYGDGTSTPTYGSTSNVATWVLMLSNSGTGSISISQLDYEFVSLTGNTGDHGTSGFMEASYNADGSLNASNSQLEGTILNFYYDVPTGERVDVEVTFDKSTMTYNVTFKSTIDMNVNFFNYHAEKYKLVVNGTSYTRGSQTVPITASTW